MTVAIEDIDITQESVDKFFDGINTEALADSLKLMERKCPYCHSSDEGGYRPLDEFELNGISGGAELNPVDNTLWYYVNNRNQSLTAGRFKVNFCPMCGRSLSEKRGR
ncbi:hypothetical protein FOL87_00030 [Lactobacillus reuteri]|uniref:hypothetical protein n=1 Tax=Limosilactobacillus reuteri TaxID=1598 RepID=UPI00146AD150|nr:hypothetical protein [Limosilactobacillus reuteri]NMV57036.1 hypothetical protein [Limosilactobacillus reuteri]